MNNPHDLHKCSEEVRKIESTIFDLKESLRYAHGYLKYSSSELEIRVIVGPNGRSILNSHSDIKDRIAKEAIAAINNKIMKLEIELEILLDKVNIKE